MTDRDKLPARTLSGHLVLPKEQPRSLVARGLDALTKKPETDPAKLFRDAVVPLDNDDFWVKVVEFLQQNWAVIEPEAAGGVRVYFVGDLRTCTPDDAIADVIGRNIESYDFLPVVSQSSPKNASVIGLFHAAKVSRAASLDGCIREHYDPLSEEFVIGADAGILDFIKDADHKPCRLVVSNSGIIGLVSLSDLQRLPVRAVLFSVITGFEITMMEAIRRSFPSDEDWLCRLSEGRRKTLEDTIAESHQGDCFVDALLFTQFCNKADITRKSIDLGKDGGRSAFASNLKKIQSLRDHVAHANEYAASPEHAQNVCTLVRDILALREKLAAIRTVGSLL
jgi:hypothetical protein